MTLDNMTLRTSFTEAMKDAMRGKDQPTVDAVRLIIAKLKEQDIISRTAGKGDEIADEQILYMLQTMIKQRRESIEMTDKGGRAELDDMERDELAVIERFVPAQMDEAATLDAIRAAIAATGATTPKDMGKVMGELKGKYAGQIDFTKASPWVKEMLG